MTRQQIFDRYCTLFENLSPETVLDLRKLVSADIHFRDPFNDTRGWEGMSRVLHDMFERCTNPRFHVLDKHLTDGCGFIRWRFETRVPVMGWFSIEGMSRLQFDEQNRIIEHLDFWDSSPFYLRLPVIGRLLRRTKAKMSAG